MECERGVAWHAAWLFILLRWLMMVPVSLLSAFWNWPLITHQQMLPPSAHGGRSNSLPCLEPEQSPQAPEKRLIFGGQNRWREAMNTLSAVHMFVFSIPLFHACTVEQPSHSLVIMKVCHAVGLLVLISRQEACETAQIVESDDLRD